MPPGLPGVNGWSVSLVGLNNLFGSVAECCGVLPNNLFGLFGSVVEGVIPNSVTKGYIGAQCVKSPAEYYF